MTPMSSSDRCPSCGLLGGAHASDYECILALRQQVTRLNAFVVALARKSA